MRKVTCLAVNFMLQNVKRCSMVDLFISLKEEPCSLKPFLSPSVVIGVVSPFEWKTICN